MVPVVFPIMWYVGGCSCWWDSGGSLSPCATLKAAVLPRLRLQRRKAPPGLGVCQSTAQAPRESLAWLPPRSQGHVVHLQAEPRIRTRAPPNDPSRPLWPAAAFLTPPLVGPKLDARGGTEAEALCGQVAQRAVESRRQSPGTSG